VWWNYMLSLTVTNSKGGQFLRYPRLRLLNRVCRGQWETVPSHGPSRLRPAKEC